MTWDTEKDFYADYGKFCISFEEVCVSMEHCIRKILFKNGLSDASIQGVLLSGYTAEPYRSLLQNLLGESIVNNEDERKIISKALSIIQKLIKKRNDIIHANWIVYGRSDEDANVKFQAMSSKLYANKNGFSKKNSNPDKQEIVELIETCRKAQLILALIDRVIMGHRSLKECFSLKNKEIIPHTDKLIKVLKNV